MPSKKVEEILAKYPTLPRGERIGCWLELRQLGADYPLAQIEYALMLRSLDHEDDVGDDPGEAVKREALSTIVRFAGPRIFKAVPEAEVIASPKEPESLNDWFWNPLQRPSLVFGLWHPRYRGRDDGALLMLAQYLTPERFPNRLFQPVLARNPSWQRILAAHPAGCLCFVGRMGLYGDEAQKRWGRPTRPLRFGFPELAGARRYPKGQIDPRFHYIVEKVRGQAPVQYRASQRKNLRTDYALVQRYTVSEGGQLTYVLCLAGATWVGTLAAAQWVAEILTSPRSPHDVIPLPKDISPESRLEVLLRVTHDVADPTWRLSRDHISICKLFLGDSEWDQESRTWRPLSDKFIIIFCEEGDPRRPVALEIDGQIQRIQRERRTAQLLSAVYEQTQGEKGAVIDPERLAQQIASAESAPDTKTIRKWLAWLQATHFPGAFSMADQIRLQATFTIQPFKEEVPATQARPAKVGR